jgi:ABC-2 type transport system ATP-binding protein
MDLLASIGAAGVTLVISSHVLKDIERLCSSVLLLNKGKLLYSGSMADLKRQSKGRFRLRIRGQAQPFLAALAREGITAEEETTALALVLAPGQTLTTVWRAALTAGVQIRELRPAADSLEAAFLRLVSGGEAA